MKQKKTNTGDSSMPYRNLDTGISRAPKEQKNSVRGTKTVSQTDLRTKKGR